MPARPQRRGPQPYAGGQFGDPQWIEDPEKAAKAEQARKAALKGPPPGLTPAKPAKDEVGARRRAKTGQEPAASPSGTAPAPAPKRTSTSQPQQQLLQLPRPTLTPPARWVDGGGFLLGLVLYTLGLNYVRYGTAGVKGWLAAKLINEPLTADQLVPAGPQHVTPGVNQPQYSIPYDGKQ